MDQRHYCGTGAQALNLSARGYDTRSEPGRRRLNAKQLLFLPGFDLLHSQSQLLFPAPGLRESIQHDGQEDDA